MHLFSRCVVFCSMSLVGWAMLSHQGRAQSVGLPAPRLLTLMPMGGAAGSEVEVEIGGESLESVDQLLFSDSRIHAEPQVDLDGEVIPGRFRVHIASDCPVGVYDARALGRLGISTPRAFVVSRLREIAVRGSNAAPDAAHHLPLGAVCNATATAKAIDYYRTDLQAGEPVLIVCNAAGIESKLRPVVTVADADGRDLQVERRRGWMVFTPEATAPFLIKIHDLTFEGGAEYYYRLSIRPWESGDDPMASIARVETVNSFSWPPAELPEKVTVEVEPNGEDQQAQRLEPPCRVVGKFFPAADVDLFELDADGKQQWWVEVASERLGLTTDPHVVVQRVVQRETGLESEDVAELGDIASPVKVSSNGYSYDGPPYNAGSNDVLGNFTAPADGRYRLRVSDLFGGTRSDPFSRYELIVREATPDFALVAWALHENMRNGDRNALSKPMALRAGSGVVLEVVAIRRDGFEGPIRLEVDGLPAGVQSVAATIPEGKSRGLLVICAGSDAPQGLAKIQIRGIANIGSEEVARDCRIASMEWPVRDAWREIPIPRLQQGSFVSVCDQELAPVTIEPSDDKPLQVVAGDTLKIPLRVIARCEISGASVKVQAVGDGWPSFSAELPLKQDVSELQIDTGKLKLSPGLHRIALYGHAVVKYAPAADTVDWAELKLEKALKRQRTIEERAKAAAESEEHHQVQGQLAVAKLAVQQAQQELSKAKANAKPRDIVDLIVSQPIRFVVHAGGESHE